MMLAAIDFPSLVFFQKVCLLLAAGLLVWDTIEVGRNDAANLVNAVFGARVLRRRTAILIVGVAVVAGAVMSSSVIDTARKGIFDPTGLAQNSLGLDGITAALTVYISVYIVDTVLLYGYSAFGMPVSTTACLVFELLGAAAAISYQTIHWDKAGIVVAGIICSIVLSAVASFLIQRAARGALRDKTQSLSALLLHGGWIGGGLCAGLFYFLLLKGMKHVSFVKSFKAWLDSVDESAGTSITGVTLLFLMWGLFAVAIHVLLVIYRKRAAKLLFPVLAVIGMVAMGFAFGQNDLANCAAPGLASITLIEHGNLVDAMEVAIPGWMLLVCGLLLFVGMASKNAERVTKAAVAAGSMGDHVALWAPNWCVNMARKLLTLRGKEPALAPRADFTPSGKTMHFDAMRACIIMAVSASVIATASSLGLPVSTTYVTFAAVVATGLADRIFQRGDAELKLGRTIWVVTSWFLSAAIAAGATFVVASIVGRLGIAGIAACLVTNMFVRRYLKKRADVQAVRVEEEAYERVHPEEFATEDE